jgi:hypothetical protein
MSNATPKPYNMNEMYVIDDRISHPGFNDSGIVCEIKQTSDKCHTCTVDFDTVGRKRLIMGAKKTVFRAVKV